MGWNDVTAQAETAVMVEDDADVAAMAQHLADVEVFADLTSFEAALDSLRPSVIILDLELPDGDGLEVLSKIRARPETEHTPVVVFTATDLDPQEGHRRGANAWVRKPSEADALEAALRAILDFWVGLNQTATAQ